MLEAMRRLALATVTAISTLLAGCYADDTAATTGSGSSTASSGTGGAGGAGGAPTIDERVAAWLSKMTLDEKIAEMHGLQLAPIDDLYWTPDDTRLKIPGFRMVDGPRGVRAGNATTFPVGMARGSTWDPPLEQRVGSRSCTSVTRAPRSCARRGI
jgi:beta-glucosidase